MVRNFLDKIKVLSTNCRGLKDRKKRYDVLNYLKNTEADIICLQETHLTQLDSVEVKKQWDGDFILNGVANNARGSPYFLEINLNTKF